MKIKNQSISAFISTMLLSSAATIAACGVIAGCGASTEEDSDDADALESGDDLGSVAQPFGAKVTPSFQFGTRNVAPRQRCDRASSGQVCLIPPKKTLSWCSATGFTQGFANDVIDGVNILDAVPGWSFPLADTVFTPCVSSTHEIEINIQSDGCGTSGTAGNNIQDYVCNDFTSLTSLTEGAGVVGNYQSWGLCKVKIDMNQILAKGASDAIDHNFFKHALQHGLEACVAVGARPGLASTYASRTAMNGNTPVTALSPGETCAMQSYTLSVPGQFFNDTPDCTQD